MEIMILKSNSGSRHTSQSPRLQTIVKDGLIVKPWLTHLLLRKWDINNALLIIPKWN